MEFLVELNELITKVDLNILPLCYYDALINMEWLIKHKAKLD